MLKRFSVDGLIEQIGYSPREFLVQNLADDFVEFRIIVSLCLSLEFVPAPLLQVEGLPEPVGRGGPCQSA